MYSDNDIINFLNTYDYDIRKTGNARWIDQKCTPDVLWSISDFIINYVDTIKEEFTVRDIWNSEYAKKTIDATFSKPNTDEKKAENEYDKFFSQPLNMLCYAHVITDISQTKSHLYRIANREILDYIARNDMCSLKFIYMYNEKVMTDSGLIDSFNTFFEKQDKTSFNTLKQSFIDLYHKWTPVKKEYEPKRIFTKVVNPLAYKLKKCGTEKGHLSKTLITKADLMYNQDNFRDIYKDKPKSEYPDIKHYLENLIALTPNQHYGFAHPNNNTQYIDPVSQKILLIAKIASIKFNLLEENEKIYDFDNLKTVLYIGFNDFEEVNAIKDNDFDYVMHVINYYYADIINQS